MLRASGVDWTVVRGPRVAAADGFAGLRARTACPAALVARVAGVAGEVCTPGMKTDELFLLSDAALRSVIDRIAPGDLDTPVPAGASVADGDDLLDRDLLGGDPIAAYGALNDAAPALVGAVVEPGTIFPCADPDTGRASDRPSALGRLQPTRTVGK